jgi:hypothetical protein
MDFMVIEFCSGYYFVFNRFISTTQQLPIVWHFLPSDYCVFEQEATEETEFSDFISVPPVCSG